MKNYVYAEGVQEKIDAGEMEIPIDWELSFKIKEEELRVSDAKLAESERIAGVNLNASFALKQELKELRASKDRQINNLRNAIHNIAEAWNAEGDK